MRQRVAIIDYGSGNLHSAAKAFERAAREAGIAAEIAVTADPDWVAAADRIVLPGVGAFADCARGLDAVAGMREALEDAVRRRGRPFLGICVGMQLLATRGLEFGETPGLGWITGDVRQIVPTDAALKVPHMGWNTIDVARPTPYSMASRPARRGCMPTSCTRFIWRRPKLRRSLQPQTMAAASRPWLHATTSPERNFIRKRARRSAWR